MENTSSVMEQALISNLTMLQRTFSLDDDHFLLKNTHFLWNGARLSARFSDFYIILILQPYEKVDIGPYMFRIVDGACLHDITWATQ